MKKLIIMLALALGAGTVTASAQSISNRILQEANQRAAEKEKAAEELYYKIVDTWKAQNYRNFIKEFPNSKYAIELEKRLNEIELWEKAKKENTAASYNNYLNSTKYNHFSSEARTARDRLESASNNSGTNTSDKSKSNTQSDKAEKAPQSTKKAIESAVEYVANPTSASSGRTQSTEPARATAASSSQLTERQILEYARKGKEYYDQGDITGAYKQFKHITRDQLPDSSYYEAYDETFEFQEYANLLSRNSVELIEEYLRKYPYGMMYEEVLQLYEEKTGHPYRP